MSTEHLNNVSRGDRNLFGYDVSFLVLDFNKPAETKACLRSIFEHTQFDNYQIVLFSNGGEQDYIIDLYNQGMIDKLILSKKNYGCGGGTHAVFDNADSEFAIYVQNDQFMCRDFTFYEFEDMKWHLENTHQCIDLAGGEGHVGKYSERAHIIKASLFKNNPDKGYGGPGPFEGQTWSETQTQLYFAENDFKVIDDWPILFGNNGRYSVREDAEGNIVRVDVFTGNREEDYKL